MGLKQIILFFLTFVVSNSFAAEEEFVKYNCFFDDHLDNHVLVGSAKINLQKGEKSSGQKVSLNISPQSLPGHRYTFEIQHRGKVGKPGFLPVPIVEVSLYDQEKEIYSMTRGKESSELYTSLVNPDLSRIEVYCSTRELKN